MWLIAMFDLPVDTRENRRAYTRFRKVLIKCGFVQLQFSVYARFMPSEDASRTYRKIVRQSLPPGGEVRLLAVTDHQYSKMEIFLEKKALAAESPPAQLGLF